MTPSLAFGKPFDLKVAGCFSPDTALLGDTRWMATETGSVSDILNMPDEIAAWRLASALRAGVTISGVRADSIPLANEGLAFLPSLPSDYILLLRDRTKYQYKWLEHYSPVPAEYRILGSLSPVPPNF